MTELSELQRWMSDALTRRRAVERDPPQVAAARARLTGNERVAPEAQLETYREQFWLRHTGALLEDFEAVAHVIEQQAWERLVEEYLAEHPPSSFTLRDLGARLPEFVRSATWLPHHPLSVDLAATEWAYVEVFDAPDSAPLDPSTLAAIPEHAWEQARLLVAPSVRLLELDFPAPTLRRQLRLGEGPTLPAQKEEHLVVVYRGGDRDLRHERLGRAEFTLLSGLERGLALLQAAEAVIALGPEAEARVESELGSWFGHFAARGWLTGVELA